MDSNMKATHWLIVLGSVALIGTACGSTHGSARSTTDVSPLSLPFTTIPFTQPGTTVATAARQLNQCQPVLPAPTLNPASASSRNLVIALLVGGGPRFVVRDITDINHPSTVSTFDAASPPKFVGASDVSYVDSDGNVVRLTYASSRKLTVARCASLFDWSPDGTALAYLSQTDSGSELRLLRGGTDRSLGPIPGTGAGGCESIGGCAIANSLDFRLSYSPDGDFISLVLSGFGKTVFRIWTSDGTLVKGSDAQGATMSVWSDSGLYFRDEGGVHVWRGGSISQFLPGVWWIRPNASPAGGQILYVSRDADGWAHTLAVDTTTRLVRELKAQRGNPVFLTNRYIWYAGERDCVPADGCGPHPPWHPASGKTYIYDLQDGTETASVITAVADIWPHAA
jgi:hypothetical protein